jgi:hypothetical protein
MIKETTSIIIAALVFTFCLVFNSVLNGSFTSYFLLIAFLVSLAVLLLNILAKKVAARIFDVSIEHKILEWKRYGLYERSFFKVPIPIGVVIPFFMTIISMGYLIVPLFLQYEVTPLLSRIKKSIGLYRFSEVTESHIGQIAVVGIVTTLALGFIAYIIGGDALLLFAKVSIFYAFWNALPLGQTDGTKIFFGGVVTWSIVAILSILALVFAIAII